MKAPRIGANNRRVVALIAGVVLAVVVALCAVAFAVEQAGEASAARDVARSRSLAAAATRVESRSPEAALRIALEAYRLVQGRSFSDGFEARDALLSIASRESRLRQVIRTSSPVVGAIAFSDDGTRLAVASRGREGVRGSIDTWQLGSLTRAGPRIRTAVNGPGVLRFTDGGRTVVWANDGTLERFEVATGARRAGKLNILPFIVQDGARVEDDPGWAQLSENGRTVVVEGPHCVFTAFDVVRGTALRSAGTCQGGLVSPDGRRIVIDEGSGTVVRDLTDGRRVSTVPTYRSIAFSADGRLLYLGDGRRLVIWDVERNRLARPPLRAPGGAGGGIAVARDGRHVATVGRDGRVRIWSLDRRNPRSPVLPGKGKVYGLSFAADGRTLAVERESGVDLVDVDRRAPLVNPVPSFPFQPTAIGPDGTTFASGSEDGVVRLWTLTRTADAELPLLSRIRHVAGLVDVGAVAFSHTGDRLVVGTDDGTVRVVDAERAAPVGPPLLGHEDFVRDVAFSPDDETVASTANNQTLRLWNASDGRQIAELPTSGIGHESNGVFEVEIAFESVAFTPDGTTLLASDETDGSIHRWDAHTLEPRMTLHEVGTTLAVAPDGRTLAAGWLLDGEIQVRTIEGDPIPPILSARDGIWDIEISRTGLLATAGTDGTISLWGISSAPAGGMELFDGSQQVDAVAFAPDGNVLVSASSAGTSFWDVARGARIGVPQAVVANALAVSPDGQTLAVASEGGLDLYDLALVGGDASYELWRERICRITRAASTQGTPQVVPGGLGVRDSCSTA